MGRYVRVGVGVLALALLSAACVSNAPQDSLDPAGPYARKIDTLFVPVLWIAIAIFVIVEGLLVLLLVKYRHREGRDRMPPQVHGNTRLEIAWTIVPALILAGVAVPTVATIWDLARKPTGNVLNVTVVGHQWWWEFQYTDAQAPDGTLVRTANELVIPVDRPVYVTLAAQPEQMGGLGNAVIHSFWVPRLAGKQDVVPFRTNDLTLQADSPGTYLGQCAELCGLSHANMRFRVIAVEPNEFDSWLAGQQQDAATPTDALAKRGMDVFLNPLSSGLGACINCHSIQGTPAQATGGPSLTHFGSRGCFAGCIFENTPENVAAWLRDPPAEKPGSLMPNYHLTDEEIDALVAYLESLQ